MRCLLPLLFLLWPNWVQSQAISNNFYAAQRPPFAGVINVASGDLNKDGKPDFVVLTNDVPQSGMASAVAWINNGKGTFTQTQQITVGETTTPALADVNGDGIPDLIYEDPANHAVLDVALGTGQGTFGSPKSYTGQPGAATFSPVIAGDFNGDGKPDIAWSRNNLSGGSVVIVFLNTGNGTFGSGTSYFMGTAPVGLAVADMNRDGIQDLVVQDSWGGAVRVFYGSTTGALRTGPAIAFNSPSAIAVGDVTGDGIPDIVVGSTTDQYSHHGITVLTGQADGSFTSRLIQDFLGPITALLLRDLNGDGKLELCLAEQNAALFNPGGFFDQSYLAVYPGNGNGTFQNPRTYNIDSDPVNVIAVDIYGDGRPALITANDNSRTLSVLRSDVPGFYVAAPITLSPHAEGIVSADFNHDGIMDMAVANDPTCKAPCNGTVTVFLGTGHGWFDSGKSYAIGMHGSGIAAGDVNGDGVLDLVVTNNTAGDNSDVSVLLGNANGTFQAARNFVLGISSSDVFLADMNRDKKLDLVTANGIALGTGTGTFGALLPFTALGSAAVDHIAVGDFNQDGIMDVAAANLPSPTAGTDDLSILLGDGSGHFVLEQSQDVGAIIQSLAVGKMNADVLPDLVASYFNVQPTGLIAVFLGQGAGMFARVGGTGYFTLPIERTGWSVAVADMNNDGFSDVVVSAGSRNEPNTLNDLIVVPGAGNGTLSGARAFTVLSGIRSRIAIADLDHDGRNDVLVTNDLGVSRALNIGSRITP